MNHLKRKSSKKFFAKPIENMLKSAFVCGSVLLTSLAGAQTTGQWPDATGTPTNAETHTNNAIGVNVAAPDGWQEIRYCPPANQDQKGLIVTREVCAPFVPPPGSTGFLGNFDGYLNPYFHAVGGTEPTLFPITSQNTYGPVPFVYYSPASSPGSGLSLNLTKNMEPLMLARTVEYSSGSNPGSVKSRFMVLPNGNSGFNTENPRAALDVQNANIPNQPVAMFGNYLAFQNAAAGSYTPPSGGPSIQLTQTNGISIVPRLGDYGFNMISHKDDVGFIFTDGKGADGKNANGALVIAPFASSNSTGGLRMEANGNTELRGEFRCTRVRVNAQWWPDNVFRKGYKLASLDSVNQFIQQNGHLPGVPSEAEVVSEGQDLGTLQQIQQTKIEELTLYTIAQEQTIQSQNEELQKTKAKLAEQELRLKKLEKLLLNHE